MKLNKGDILERDGQQYEILITDDELFVISMRSLMEDGGVYVGYTDVEFYSVADFDNLGFNYLGSKYDCEKPTTTISGEFLN